MRLRSIFLLLVVHLAFVGCGSSTASVPPSSPPPSSSSVDITETGSATSESVVEVIHMNNCGGKAEAKQIVQRDISVILEGEAQLGIDVKVVRANLLARYTESKGSSKSIELIAPSGTNMEFTLTWQEQPWLGTITSSINTAQVRYQARVPIAVELTSSNDKICDMNGHQPSNNGQQPLATVVIAMASTPEPLPTVISPPNTSVIPSSDFRLDLSSYEVGDIPNQLGTDLIIAERDGRKYVGGFVDGARMKIDHLQMRDAFEVVFTADLDVTSEVLTLSSGSEDIVVEFLGDKITFGETQLDLGRASWQSGTAINECRLLVKNGIAKFYVNNKFFGTKIVPSDAVYTKLTISGILKKTAIFSLQVTSL
jgi:hypothetical protein